MTTRSKRPRTRIVHDAVMLFLPPRPPVLIPRTRDLILGRCTECDLQIPSRAASRRHASVGYRQDRTVIIQDLQSKNGTFLNGRSFQGLQPLKPGDVIQIGSTEITFCRMDNVPASFDESEITSDLTPDTEMREQVAFHGHLRDIPVHALLQILADQRQTGRFEVVTVEGPVRMWFSKGKPVHAEGPGGEGIDAALTLLALDRGPFAFEPGYEAPTRSLGECLTALALEHGRREDEWTRDEF